MTNPGASSWAPFLCLGQSIIREAQPTVIVVRFFPDISFPDMDGGLFGIASCIFFYGMTEGSCRVRSWTGFHHIVQRQYVL